jgi:bifunctional non-homologous end joining protein LigD
VDKELILEGKRLYLTNLDKVYWPDEGYTKQDLIAYYLDVGQNILPFLKERPESLHRHPHGISGGGSFYQKDVKEMTPDWVKKYEVFSEAHEGKINFLIANDLPTLIYMANLGCIEINPWNSKLPALDNPDYIVLDLDPEDIEFDAVVQTALLSHRILDELNVLHRVKTSGATGLHIYIPLGAKYDYQTAKHFANMLAAIIHQREPRFTSLERSPSKRQKKVYVDYLQNNRGQTLASCFSVRPRPGAPVSMPLTWPQLERGIRPLDFTIKNAPELIRGGAGADFEAVLSDGADIETVMKSLQG